MIPLFTNQYFIIVQVGCRTIIIEPTKLGDETSRWISIGNLLHKVALMSGFGAFAIGIMFAQDIFQKIELVKLIRLSLKAAQLRHLCL